MIKTELRRMATTFTFMTRFPLVARWGSGEPEELGASTRYFPLVGYAVGGIGAAVFYYGAYGFSHSVAALLATITLVMLTGAFHEDGLADAADGFGGAFEPARKLEIMRDSRIGTYGACALIALFLLRWQLLVELPVGRVFFALISAHVVARWSSLLIGWMLPYVREGASNKPMADGIGRREVFIATLITAAWLIVQPQMHGLSMIVAVLVSCVAAAIFRRQIGGVTGDALGAANVAVEIAALMAWNFADRLMASRYAEQMEVWWEQLPPL